MPVFNNILAGASGQTSEAAAGYQIDRSLRFNSGDAAHLQKVPSSTGNRKTWTWSCWFKRSRLSLEGFLLYSDVNGGNYRDAIRLESSNKLRLYLNGGVGASFLTDQVFRDPSSWYHLVIAVDTTQATASDRVKFYINGSQITSFSSATYPTQNYETGTFVSGKTARIGRDYSGNYFNGYLTDVHFIDGQALAASDFGEYDDNNVWQPKEFGGSFFTSVSTATGALPIHNTSGTFGGTKVTGNRTDPNASNLVLAISGSGSYQDISATIKGSGTNKTVTANGNVTTSSSEGKYYGGGSLDLTGSSGDYFSIPNSSDFAFGTGDFTVEFWIKTTDTAFNILDITAGGGWSTVLVNAGAQLFWQTNRATTNLFNISTNNDLIDGAWHHVAFVRSSNVVKPYLDGVQIGNSSGYTDNTDYDVTTGSLNIGSGANGVLDGYMQDIRIYKGVAKYTSNFTVAAPNSSFHLDFSDNTSTTTIAEDSSGNDNDWTAYNISVASGAGNDSLIDTPTNYTADSGNNGGNYATMNPLDNANGLTLSNGNLDAENTAASNKGSRLNFKFPSSGKWYIEAKALTLGGNVCLGVSPENQSATIAVAGTNYIVINSSGSLVQRYYGSSNSTYTSAFDSYSTGAILQIAYDADSEKLWFGLNNQWMDSGTTVTGNPSDGSNPTLTGMSDIFPSVSLYTSKLAINAGQRPFAHTPPTGYVSLCTQNLPDPTIADGSTAFDTSIWSGNSTQDRKISTAFSPDLVWVKRRNSTKQHILIDKLRGDDNYLHSNTTNANQVQANILGLVSDGYELGTVESVNLTNNTYVGWAWDAGSSTVSNTDGSTTSSVRANASAGFSIVTWTGTGANATIGHGLSDQPSLIIVKDRDSSSDWRVYHNGGDLTTNSGGSFSPFYHYRLNTTAGGNGSAIQAFTNTRATSSVFTYAASPNVNNNDFVAYCWAAVEGYSKFGTYTGNSSSDGVFINTGFRPAFVLIKTTNTASSWYVYDSGRETYNAADTALYPNLNNAEGTNTAAAVDFVSNGFKLRGNAGATNSSSNTYIYAAFAEHPFKTSRAR